MLKQSAEIVEVFLISGYFLAGISRPLSFEFCGGHRRTFSARTSKGLSPSQERSGLRQKPRRSELIDNADYFASAAGFTPAFSFKSWVNSWRPETIWGALL